MNKKVKIIISVVLALGLIIPVALLAISAAIQSLPFYILPMLSYGAKNTSTGQNITLKNVSIYQATKPMYYGATTRIQYQTNYNVNAWESYQLNFMFDMQAFAINNESENIRFNFDIWAKSFKIGDDIITVRPTGGQIIIVDNSNKNMTLTSGKITIDLGSKYNIDNDNVTQYNIGFNFSATQWKNYWTANGMSKMQIYLNFKYEISSNQTTPYEKYNPLHELWLSDFTITYDQKEPEVPTLPDPESSEEPSAPPVEPSEPEPPIPPDPESSEEPSAPPVEPSEPPEESSNGSGGGDTSNGGEPGGGCGCDGEHICGILEQIKLEILVLQEMLQLAIDGNAESLKQALEEHAEKLEQVINNNAEKIAEAIDRQTSELANMDESATEMSGADELNSNMDGLNSLEEGIKSNMPDVEINNSVYNDIDKYEGGFGVLFEVFGKFMAIDSIKTLVIFSLTLGLAMFILGKREKK